MKNYEKFFMGTGIALLGSALSWITTCGITFILDDAHHAQAILSSSAGGEGSLMLIGVFGSIFSFFGGYAYSLTRD